MKISVASFVLVLPIVLSACASKTLEVQEKSGAKKNISKLCYMPVVVTKNIEISVTEQGVPGGMISNERMKLGAEKVMQATKTFVELTPQSFVNAIRPYSVSLSQCPAQLSPGTNYISFVIHRGVAERAPIGIYKTGVGFRVTINESPSNSALWQAEFYAGTMGGSFSGPEIEEVDAFTKKLVWELYQRDWIEKR